VKKESTKSKEKHLQERSVRGPAALTGGREAWDQGEIMRLGLKKKWVSMKIRCK